MTAPKQHPECIVCARLKRACPYHASTDPTELARVLTAQLTTGRGLALADFYAAASVGMATLPRAVLSTLEGLDVAPLEARLHALSKKPEVGARDLQELGAVALALATMLDVIDQQESDE